MATRKPFMMAAAALALLAMVLMCSAPPALAEGQELLHADAEKTETSGEALQTEPDDKKTELSEADEKKWGRSPAWPKAPHHHGHHGHHDDRKPSHHGKPPHYDHNKPPHYDHDKQKPYPSSPPYDHDKKKPYPSPPY